MPHEINIDAQQKSPSSSINQTPSNQHGFIPFKHSKPNHQVSPSTDIPNRCPKIDHDLKLCCDIWPNQFRNSFSGYLSLYIRMKANVLVLGNPPEMFKEYHLGQRFGDTKQQSQWSQWNIWNGFVMFHVSMISGLNDSIKTKTNFTFAPWLGSSHSERCWSTSGQIERYTMDL